MSDDEQQYEQGLQKTVAAAILEKFLAASGKVALAHSDRTPPDTKVSSETNV